jgi:predicted metal-dependent hydrolase
MTIPRPRALDIDLSRVPRRWAADSAFATALSSGISMLFPDGERFFVRSVKRLADRIADPELQAQIKGFFAQEGRHAAAHDDANDLLRRHGYEIDRFLARYRRVMTALERATPAKLNLASTAAAEHFTAILAEGAFKQGILDRLHPQMQRLFAWHAAEEIEHKAVAFDVLRAVAPSYTLRIAGLAYATIVLATFWAWGTAILLHQDRPSWRELRRELAAQRRSHPVVRRVFVAGIRQYLRRDFHPADNANEHLAAVWFAAHGQTLPDAA